MTKTKTNLTPVHILENDYSLARMFAEEGGYYPVPDPAEAEIIVYPGGPDVNPARYGDCSHPTTHFSLRREQTFDAVRHDRRNRGKLHVGICGGGQYLNVEAGGRMYQDVDCHAIAGTHELQYEDRGNSRVYMVTSTHHQMMRPGIIGEVWGWADLSTYRDSGNQRREPRKSGDLDIEIVWYLAHHSLCFQPHPEYGVEECKELFFRCLNRARMQCAV